MPGIWSSRGGWSIFSTNEPCLGPGPPAPEARQQNPPDKGCPLRTLAQRRLATLRWAATPWAATQPLYLNSFSLFPRRSRTSQWELKASWGGIPQRMMAFRKAFRCRALKPNTWVGRELGGGAENSGIAGKGLQRGGAGRSTEKAGASSWDRTQRAEPRPRPPPLHGCDPGQASGPPAFTHAPHPKDVAGVSSLYSGRGRGAEKGVCRGGPTSIFPPTRARRGGRGLSLSLFSCLRDCRRPPGK